MIEDYSYRKMAKSHTQESLVAHIFESRELIRAITLINVILNANFCLVGLLSGGIEICTQHSPSLTHIIVWTILCKMQCLKRSDNALVELNKSDAKSKRRFFHNCTFY